MYTWDKDLETGNEAIDRQHKELLTRLNMLLQACQDGQGKAEAEQTMEFLLSYTVKHFADEEKAQQETGYPAYLDHKRRHNDFKKTAVALAQELRESGPGEAFAGKICVVIGEWLLHHIRGDDFRFAAYMRHL